MLCRSTLCALRDSTAVSTLFCRQRDFQGPERPSVFDGDEFDPRNGLPFDMTRVHKGKRGPAESETSAEEKSELARRFGQVVEWEEVVGDNEDLEYNGESFPDIWPRKFCFICCRELWGRFVTGVS